MEYNYLSINKIINVDKYQKLQDDISLSTGLALLLIDYKGTPFTTISNCSEFCHKMRTQKNTRALCEKCDALGGLEAVRIHDTHIYICHAGLVEIAIPIIVEGLFLGSIIAGQVRLENQSDVDQLDSIMYDSNRQNKLQLDKQYKLIYDLMPMMSLKKIKALSHMLHYFTDLCVERSFYRLSSASTDNYNISQLNSPNEEITLEHKKNTHKGTNILLQPSLNYIRNHLNEKITLNKLADLCHISPSYYSKLFASLNIGSLSTYVNHLKIEKAKEFLCDTNLSISSIANDLGYRDSSYFIKLFRLETGQTPTSYRTLNQ